MREIHTAVYMRIMRRRSYERQSWWWSSENASFHHPCPTVFGHRVCHEMNDVGWILQRDDDCQQERSQQEDK